MFILLVLSQLVEPAVGPQSPRADAADSLSIPVVLTDYAAVPAEELRRAREQVTRIFGAIGIDMSWLEGREGMSMPAHGLAVVIARRPGRTAQPLADGVTGAAADAARSRGQLVYVFYDQLDQRRLRRGELLGYVIAHEIGHLLLPFGSHSRDGIMRARWDTRDLERAESGRLTFAPEQVDQIRANVIARLANAPAR